MKTYATRDRAIAAGRKALADIPNLEQRTIPSMIVTATPDGRFAPMMAFRALNRDEAEMSHIAMYIANRGFCTMTATSFPTAIRVEIS